MQELDGVRVRVRKNIVEGDYSVLVKGKVVARQNLVVLKDVVFVVSEAGNRRAREQGVRNVHAFADGVYVVTPLQESLPTEGWVPVTYHYKLHSKFVNRESGISVERASSAIFLKGCSVLAYGAA